MKSIKLNAGTAQEAEANAAFICKAVNCHDELLTALKAALVTIEVLAEDANYNSQRWRAEHITPIETAINNATK